jgi:hypothetical protein
MRYGIETPVLASSTVDAQGILRLRLLIARLRDQQSSLRMTIPKEQAVLNPK